ncbi:12697_t:CDS:2 [Gigaspora margarita]|uniref:12697_t:CDS:1 n=1 Tax=Gigaspora margarita TaxID=4874 RepID=A0ABN7W356_GIGMA|nr:12697_t:CDS:2 [Gigaspora margarita]
MDIIPARDNVKTNKPPDQSRQNVEKIVQEKDNQSNLLVALALVLDEQIFKETTIHMHIDYTEPTNSELLKMDSRSFSYDKSRKSRTLACQ